MREACGAASVGTLMVMAMTGRAGKGGSSSVGNPPSTRSQGGQKGALWVLMATKCGTPLERTGEQTVMKGTQNMLERTCSCLCGAHAGHGLNDVP